MIVAMNAIGQHYLGEQRAAMAAFTLGLLVTFLAVRINTRLIRAKVKWWFHDIESEGGVHVHHMVIGVVIMVVGGITLIAMTPSGIWLQLVALVFGAGVALTLDEFALILRLQDVYWRAEGRLSVDAVIIAVCAGFFFILGFRPGGVEGTDITGVWAEIAVAATVVVNMCFAVVCLFKGKYWTGFFGVFIPIVGVVGAVRLARPQSPWARRRYATRPKKLARAQRREQRMNATWDAWREAFFDLIAGKPHLPSLPPLGPNGVPEEAPVTAAEAEAVAEAERRDAAGHEAEDGGAGTGDGGAEGTRAAPAEALAAPDEPEGAPPAAP